MTSEAFIRPVGALSTTIELDAGAFVEPPAASGRFALIVYHGARTELFTLDARTPLVVGRNFPADVQLADPSVSRQHARFSLREGQVWVEDLDSKNRTRVNGKEIRERALTADDRVQVGGATLLVARSRAEDHGQSERPSDAPRHRSAPPDGIVIAGPRLKALYERADQAAQVDAPVIVLGETGTGKEHVARRLHRASPRASGPLVCLNCATVPEGLVASTLFGHERGAFTGATHRQEGVFERAQGGVLFLDEIGELPLELQPALLRVLENRTFCRVGAAKELQTDARIVAATHCDLLAMVEEGTFREDLYYRLNTLTLEVPPLRERREELQPLAEHFLLETARMWQTKSTRFDDEVFVTFDAYDWPGNVRQLRNVVERAALVAAGDTVRVAHLPEQLLQGSNPQRASQTSSAAGDDSLKRRLDDFEADALRAALQRTGGNRSAAARLLRMPTASLFRRLKALKID